MSYVTTANGSSQKRQKVLIFGIDGCRSDALLFAQTPNIDKFIQDDRTAYSFHVQCEPISLSGPNWASIVTGTKLEKHNVLNNFTTPDCLGEIQNVFGLMKKFLGSDRTSVLYNAIAGSPPWPGVKNLLFHGSDICNSFHDTDEYKNAIDATTQICSDLDSSKECADISFFYSHLPDGVGHRLGFSLHLEEYRRTITACDDAFGKILSVVKTRMAELDEDWLVLVVTDHGGTTKKYMPRKMQRTFDRTANLHYPISQVELQGVHGLDISQHRNVFLLLGCADGITGGEMLPAPELIHVVPFVLSHLGCSAEDLAMVGLKLPIREDENIGEGRSMCTCCTEGNFTECIVTECVFATPFTENRGKMGNRFGLTTLGTF